jgi:hypothetical protein
MSVRNSEVSLIKLARHGGRKVLSDPPAKVFWPCGSQCSRPIDRRFPSTELPIEQNQETQKMSLHEKLRMKCLPLPAQRFHQKGSDNSDASYPHLTRERFQSYRIGRRHWA